MIAYGMFAETSVTKVFVGGIAIVLLTALLPLFKAQSVDFAWVGVFEVKMPEIGMIPAPAGLNTLVNRNVAGEHATVVQIYRGVIPFLLADIVVVAVIVALPVPVLFLLGPM